MFIDLGNILTPESMIALTVFCCFVDVLYNWGDPDLSLSDKSVHIVQSEGFHLSSPISDRNSRTRHDGHKDCVLN